MRVVIESPYAGDIDRNIDYAKLCIKDSLNRSECPIASHLLFTQEGILDDKNPHQRAQGIQAGLAWQSVADAVVFYVDYGYSNGMNQARHHAQSIGATIFERRILQG